MVMVAQPFSEWKWFW